MYYLSLFLSFIPNMIYAPLLRPMAIFISNHKPASYSLPSLFYSSSGLHLDFNFSIFSLFTHINVLPPSLSQLHPQYSLRSTPSPLRTLHYQPQTSLSFSRVFILQFIWTSSGLNQPIGKFACQDLNNFFLFYNYNNF